MLEPYVDMAINAFTIYLSYMLGMLINPTPPIDPTALKTLSAILAIIIVESLVQQTINNLNPSID